jgi:Flp pilus assembly protein TadD/TolB-like protein
VYRAWDPKLDREVALKLIPVASGNAAASIIREGRLLARVRHPNVVTIHGADQIDGYIGLWMELVPGRTLEELLRARTTFEPAEVTRIGIELCQALSAVHAAGLLHRDIKAQNVMRADDGRVVLMDFGAGRELTDEESDLTGTPLYLAPELFQGQPATIRSDVYSLGVLLYHLLTASYPVEGKTVREVRDAHARGTRAPLNLVESNAPRRVARVVERAIDPRPEQRYQSAAAFGTGLKTAATSPLRRWRWHAAAAIVLAFIFAWKAASPALTEVERPSIAVAFGNVGVESDSQVVDGFNIEMLRSLRAIDGLVVWPAAPKSGNANSRDAKTSARQLGASFLLEGTVLRSPQGRQWRVEARLTSVADGDTRWTLRSRDNDDLQVHQRQIAAEIARLFGLQAAVGRYKLDPVLYDMFLEARSLQAKRHVDNTEHAAKFYEFVITRAPSFTPALGAWVSAKSWGRRAAPEAEMRPLDPRVEARAREALRLDDKLSEAHAAMGWWYSQNLDWDSANASWKTALELDPNNPIIASEYVITTLQPTGEFDEALRVMTEAHRNNPSSLDVLRVLGDVQIELEMYDDAVENLQRIHEQNPDFPYARRAVARALFGAGKRSEAISLIEAEVERSNRKGEPGPFGVLAYMYAKDGRVSDARRLVAQHQDKPGRLTMVYAGLGDVDGAIRALLATEKVHPWRAATNLNRLEMRSIRDSGDPRVVELKSRVRLKP